MKEKSGGSCSPSPRSHNPRTPKPEPPAYSPARTDGWLHRAAVSARATFSYAAMMDADDKRDRPVTHCVNSM
ncbi:unnamed protein product, partial [Iphiclides podalirius]